MIRGLDGALGNRHAGDLLWGRNRLSVLVYHRVVPDDSRDVFDPDVVSATPQDFARQMEYLARNFSVIGLGDLVSHVIEGRPLPPRPAMVTFDDGYRDNHEHALPVLRALGLPSTVFLATGFIGTERVPWWDAVADLMARAPVGEVDLPIVGPTRLDGVDGNRAIRVRLVNALKSLPDDGPAERVPQIAEALGMDVRQPERPLFMTWDEARDAHESGMTCQPHSVSHPLLTNVSRERADTEVTQSAAEVSRRVGGPSVAFAYPNGNVNESVMDACREAGIRVAFTMKLGPTRRARSQPLAIPRVSVGRGDDPRLFRLKANGALARIMAAKGLADRVRATVHA